MFIKQFYQYTNSNLWLFLLLLSLNENFYDISNLWSINIINTKLLNGLFFTHPWLNYLFLTLFIGLYIILYFYRISIKNINYFKVYLNLVFKNNFYIIFVSICLGSWWAQQELDWGGWWSWDLIEFISLLYCAILIFIVHLNKFNSLNFIFNYIYNVIPLLIFFIILVRYNQILSIHNFLGLIEVNQWFFIFYLYFFILITNYIILFLNINFKKLNYLNIYLFIFFNLVFTILIYKHFITYYEIEDYFSNYGDLIKLYFIYLLYLASGFIMINYNIIYLISFGFLNIYILFFFFYKEKRKKLIVLFHFIIYTFIILSFLTGFNWVFILDSSLLNYNLLEKLNFIINYNWEYSFYIFDYIKDNVWINNFINLNFVDNNFNKQELTLYQETYYYFYNKINIFLDFENNNIEIYSLILFNIFNLYFNLLCILVIILFSLIKINNKLNYCYQF